MAGVIEAVMSSLMICWERMKKVTAEQVLISSVCVSCNEIPAPRRSLQ